MTERVSIEVVEGDTWRLQLQVLDSAGAAYDFTSQTAHMDIRRATNSADPLTSLTDGSGLTLDSPSAGFIEVAVPSDATEGVCRSTNTETLYSDIELRSADDPPVVTTLARIKWLVQPEATHRV